jgi:DNA-binding NarL/FixJ family response regulator
MRATDLFRRGASPEERDVFTLMQEGRKGKVIAAQLGMTESTVSRLRNRIEARIVAIAQELTAPVGEVH